MLPPNKVMPVSLAGGLELKADPKVVVAPKTIQAQNAVYQTNGTVRKRNGYAALPNASYFPATMATSAITAGVVLGAAGNIALLTDGANAYSYSTAQNRWDYTGTTPNVTLKINQVGAHSSALQASGLGQDSNIANIDYAEYGNYRVVVYDTLDGSKLVSSGNPYGLGTVYAQCYQVDSGALLWSTSWKIDPEGGGGSNSVTKFGTTTSGANGAITSYQGAGAPRVQVVNGYFLISCLYSAITTFSSTTHYCCYPALYNLNSTSGSQPNNPISSSGGLGTNVSQKFVNGINNRPFFSQTASNSPQIVHSPGFNAVTYDVATSSGTNTFYFYPSITSVQTSTQYSYGNSVVYSSTSGSCTATSSSYSVTYSNPAPITALAVSYVGGGTDQLFALTSGGTTAFTGSSLGNVASTIISGYTCYAVSGTQFVACGLNSSGQLVWEGYGISGVTSTRNMTGTTTNTGSGSACVPISRIFAQGNYWYVWAIGFLPAFANVFEDAALNSTVLIQLPATIAQGLVANEVAHLFYDVGSNIEQNLNANNVSNVVYYFPCSVNSANQALLLKSVNTQYAGVSFNFTTFTVGGAQQIIPTPSGAFITGSVPAYFDSVNAYNAWHEVAPTILTQQLASGGSLTVGFQYQLAVVAYSFDQAGNVLYSAPYFAPITGGTLPTSGNQTITATAAYTGGPPGTVVEWYMTSATLPGQYYRTGIYGTSFSLAAELVYPNGEVTLQQALDAQATIYSPPGSGELPNDPPPPTSFAASNGNRMFCVPIDNPTYVYYSKPYNVGRGLEFSALQYFQVDATTGPISALSVINGNLVIFKQTAIYVVTGNGPDATGNGSFAPPQRVVSDVGCQDPGSVVTLSMGTVFRSARGLELLDQGLTQSYLGEAVETLLANVTITSVLNVPSQSQLRFFLSNGTAIVFDYFLTRWSTFTNYSGISSTLVGSTAYWVTSAGVVNYETPGTFQDPSSTPIVLSLTTPWISMTGLQGFGRLRRVLALGDYYSAHTATLNFWYDYSLNGGTYPGQGTSIPQYSEAFSTATGLINGDTVYQWQTRAPRQVCQSVMLQLLDSSVTGQNYDITNLLLEYKVKSGKASLPYQKSV